MRLKLNEIKLKLLSAEGKRASLIFLLILIPLLIFGISKVNVKNESIVQIPESQYLYVKDYYLNEPREFVFEFSDPVDQHLLEHHFFISPELKGKLVENGNDKKYKFIADTDIPENSFITITILAGLTSKNRKPFLEDFYMDFDNTAQAENIFTKNDIPGRVMSFASGKPVDLTIEKHKGAKTMTVNVYKSDNASLLNFLSYKTVKEGDDSFSYDQEVFIRNRVNHPKEALFESRVIKESKSSQKFNLEPGIYYIEATDGKNKSFSASYLIVSKNGVALRQDDQKIVLANFDTNTGAKIKEGAEAVLYNLKDAPTRMGTFKYNEQEKGFNVPFTDRIDAALVTIGSETVFVPLKVSYSFADIRATKDLEKYPKIFIYTERPIYKPGDRVFFRGIVRYDSDSLYKVPSAGTPVYINTQNYSEGNKEPTKLTVLTDSKGLFYGDYEISKEKKAGTEYLQASLLPPKENSSSYPFFSANYDVAVYTKPKYEIKVEAVNTEYLKHEKDVSPPIWIMRQAGRYLPEYRKLRMKAKNFLEFCYNIDLAVEATLQPIKRFNLSAAIIFSDILVIPDSLGIRVSFIENEGPVIETVRTTEEFDKIINCNNSKLIPIYRAIEKVKKKLSSETSLIGFSGGIWTLFSYIVEGKGSKDITIARSIFYKDKVFFKNFTDILIQKVSEHLINQIRAGADIIQIFDSYAGFVSSEEYEEVIIKPTNKVINLVKKVFPNIPIICFPRGSGLNYKIFCEKVACDIISIDQFMDLKWIKDNSYNKVIQGNLDPAILLIESQDLIKEKVDHIFEVMRNEKFIFNLGHGILPSTPVKNVEFLVNYVRERN